MKIKPQKGDEVTVKRVRNQAEHVNIEIDADKGGCGCIGIMFLIIVALLFIAVCRQIITHWIL